MRLLLIGINHKTAPLKVRERISFNKKQLKDALMELKKMDLVFGTVILSTCNRTEIYIHLSKINSGLQKTKRFIYRRFQVKEDGLKRYFYILENNIDVARHIFRVASGLDSQVLGETQILGQVKSAWTVARDLGVTSELLDGLFDKAVKMGKIVRRETKISQGNVSIGSVAIKICEDRLQDLQDKSVLIIGAGKIGTLISKYLKDRNIKGIFVSNRTYEKARELALNCGGEAINFSRLKEKLKTVDIVISSTASPHLVLRKETLTEVMHTRKKPLLIMDLALPRDIDPEAKDIPDIALYDLDDLKSVVEENYNKRIKEANLAEKIIQRELKYFCKDINWLIGEDERDKESSHWISREQISFGAG
jgi:glutamyl-tRNA reductase